MMELVTNNVFEDAGRELASSPYADIRSLSVDVEGSRLVLYGNVRSYYLKQLAQENLRAIALACGCRIVNKVDVIDVQS